MDPGLWNRESPETDEAEDCRPPCEESKSEDMESILRRGQSADTVAFTSAIETGTKVAPSNDFEEWEMSLALGVSS
jgi:hypothetical protein